MHVANPMCCLTVHGVTTHVLVQSSSASMAPETLQPQIVPAGGKGEYVEVLSTCN